MWPYTALNFAVIHYTALIWTTPHYSMLQYTAMIKKMFILKKTHNDEGEDGWCLFQNFAHLYLFTVQSRGKVLKSLNLSKKFL